MKHALTIIALVLCALALRPEPARCFGCYSGKCYSGAICGRKCVCMKQGLDIHGFCYSMD